MELSETVPLASFEVQPSASDELILVRMTPIEPQLAVGRRVYALNLEQAAALRDHLDEAIRHLWRDLRVTDRAR